MYKRPELSELTLEKFTLRLMKFNQILSRFSFHSLITGMKEIEISQMLQHFLRILNKLNKTK